MEAHMNPNKKEMEKMHQQYCRKFLTKEQVGAGGVRKPELRHGVQVTFRRHTTQAFDPTRFDPSLSIHRTPPSTSPTPRPQREMSMSCVLWEEHRKMIKKGGPLDL